jgi:dienelactone hydrolase
MLTRWPESRQLGPHRIRAFGFSAGGATVLILAGGVPDLTRSRPTAVTIRISRIAASSPLRR